MTTTATVEEDTLAVMASSDGSTSTQHCPTAGSIAAGHTIEEGAAMAGTIDNKDRAEATTTATTTTSSHCSAWEKSTAWIYGRWAMTQQLQVDPTPAKKRADSQQQPQTT